MKNNITILDSFTETETRQKEQERIVIDIVEVKVNTDFLVIQLTKKDAQLLAGLSGDYKSVTIAMQGAGRRLARKLEDIGISPTRG
tara:strand:+ start:104 stop:361 length:258 start_codon:yes stop_codon:yes gene_type:complete